MMEEKLGSEEGEPHSFSLESEHDEDDEKEEV
jgi:hypothetical protein